MIKVDQDGWSYDSHVFETFEFCLDVLFIQNLIMKLENLDTLVNLKYVIMYTSFLYTGKYQQYLT